MKEKQRRSLVFALYLVPMAFLIPDEHGGFERVTSVVGFLSGWAVACVLSVILGVGAFILRFLALHFVLGSSDAASEHSHYKYDDLSLYSVLGAVCGLLALYRSVR